MAPTTPTMKMLQIAADQKDPRAQSSLRLKCLKNVDCVQSSQQLRLCQNCGHGANNPTMKKLQIAKGQMDLCVIFSTIEKCSKNCEHGADNPHHENASKNWWPNGPVCDLLNN